LELFQRKVFATAATTQFLSNGVSDAAQMLVPFYLIRVCGKSPSQTGLMLAPLGLTRVKKTGWKQISPRSFIELMHSARRKNSDGFKMGGHGKADMKYAR
jgi:hypothetical protein